MNASVPRIQFNVDWRINTEHSERESSLNIHFQSIDPMCRWLVTSIMLSVAIGVFVFIRGYDEARMTIHYRFLFRWISMLDDLKFHQSMIHHQWSIITPMSNSIELHPEIGTTKFVKREPRNRDSADEKIILRRDCIRIQDTGFILGLINSNSSTSSTRISFRLQSNTFL